MPGFVQRFLYNAGCNMVFAISGLLINIACWKWGDWKRWRLYYPTILFFIIGNMVCDLLLYHKPLWEYTDIFGIHMFLTIGLMLLMYPGTAILYLTFFPKGVARQIPYILLWALAYVAIEAISVALGIFTYHHGWTLLHTLAHNIVMFLLLKLHYEKPLLAWPAAFLLAFLIMWAFAIPTEIVH